MCNADVAKRLRRAMTEAAATSRKIARRPDYAPRALFAPCRALTMASRPLEQSRISGILSAGTESGAGSCSQGPEAKGKMRSFLVAFAGLMLFATGAAQANVAITVDKNNQMMTVAVDGVERYQWPVSTGNPSHETPNGTFRTFRMEEDHFSKEFDDAPMPHSIFFTKIGHAIHGTDSESRLGTPVSHGCVRLSRANATTLYALVEKEGVLNTTVTLTGSSQIALARNPRSRPIPPSPAATRATQYAPQYQRRRRARRADAAAAGARPSIAAGAGRRRLYLSGRRQLGRARAIRRRAPAGASTTRRPIRSRNNITITAATRPIRAAGLRAAALLSAARAVRLPERARGP